MKKVYRIYVTSLNEHILHNEIFRRRDGKGIRNLLNEMIAENSGLGRRTMQIQEVKIFSTQIVTTQNVLYKAHIGEVSNIKDKERIQK